MDATGSRSSKSTISGRGNVPAMLQDIEHNLAK